MNERRVGVRQLRERLSAYLRQVKAGETITVTEHGRPVGRLVPAACPLDERLAAMVEAGLAEWSGERFDPPPPTVRVHEDHSVADLLIEDRA